MDVAMALGWSVLEKAEAMIFWRGRRRPVGHHALSRRPAEYQRLGAESIAKRASSRRICEYASATLTTGGLSGPG
jgi:hypothetical protein